ncbi:hypothetical protein ACWEHA_06570 [Amycolatopsis nivea]
MPETMLAAAAQASGGRAPAGHLAKPRRLKSDTESIGTLLDSDDVAPDLLVELLLPLLWLDHAAGAAGSLCVSGSMMLHYAYAQLGIASEVHAVDVVITDERTQQHVAYGRQDPYWDGETFHGHCLLHLPRTRRMIDPAVEQFPEVKRSNLPLFGRTVVTGSDEVEGHETLGQGELPPYSVMYTRRGTQAFLHTVVGQEYARIAWESPHADKDAERYHAAGVNLATHALSLLRLPGVADRVRQVRYPKLNALLDVIAEAPIAADHVGDFHVTLAGRNLRIDEIPLPAEAYDEPPELAPPVPHVVMDKKKVQAALEEVDTAIGLYATTPDELGGGSLPVVVFEPQKVIGATSPHTGETVELQIEHIVSSGFRRLPRDTEEEMPRLPTWSVRRTAVGMELWDHGGIWARGDVVPDEEWLQAAEKHKRVLVVYGLLCGVGGPEGKIVADEDRADLFLRAGRSGFVAAAIVAWRWPSSSAAWQRQDR